MRDGGPRPIVTQFVAEMLNDPHCESVLLDVREDARVEGEYSVSIRNAGTNKTITRVERGRGARGASGTARRNQDKTIGGQMIKLFDWEFLKCVTEVCENYASKGGNDSLGLEVSAWNNSIRIVVVSLGHRFIFEADTVRGYRATIFEQVNRYWGPIFDVGYTFDGDEIVGTFNSFLAYVEVESN